MLEGVQHNTYDVEFYGPNPLCGIYYLGALRAGEEMARAAGRYQAAADYRQPIRIAAASGSTPTCSTANTTSRKSAAFPKDQIAPATVGNMGAENTENPEYQVGDGCLLDQLIGQYLAEVAGLGPLVDPAHIRKTLQVHLALQLQAAALRS